MAVLPSVQSKLIPYGANLWLASDNMSAIMAGMYGTVKLFEANNNIRVVIKWFDNTPESEYNLSIDDQDWFSTLLGIINRVKIQQFR